MSIGRITARVVECILALPLVAMAVERFLAGRPDVATKNAIVAIAIIATVEALIWLVKTRGEKRWPISSDELLFRIIQVLILAAMFADGAAWLLTDEGFGVNQLGSLIALLALEGVVRRFVRPDPRPLEMAQALGQLQAQVQVFTQLPPEQVKRSLGLVRGLSDIEASSRRDFELAEQEALYAMLKEARALGANAVIDARLTTGTYETAGSQWQVARPVYTGTAVRI